MEKIISFLLRVFQMPGVQIFENPAFRTVSQPGAAIIF